MLNAHYAAFAKCVGRISLHHVFDLLVVAMYHMSFAELRHVFQTPDTITTFTDDIITPRLLCSNYAAFASSVRGILCYKLSHEIVRRRDQSCSHDF